MDAIPTIHQADHPAPLIRKGAPRYGAAEHVRLQSSDDHHGAHYSVWHTSISRAGWVPGLLSLAFLVKSTSKLSCTDAPGSHTHTAKLAERPKRNIVTVCHI